MIIRKIRKRPMLTTSERIESLSIFDWISSSFFHPHWMQRVICPGRDEGLHRFHLYSA